MANFITPRKGGFFQDAGFTITGAPELDRKFATLTASIQRKALRRGVNKGARVLQKKMKALTPRSALTGTTSLLSRNTKAKRAGGKTLQRSITVRPSSTWRSKVEMARKGIIGAAVGPEWPYGAAAHLLEFGHALVAWGHRASQRVKPYPFMRPAVDSSKGEIFSAQASELARQVQRESPKTT